MRGSVPSPPPAYGAPSAPPPKATELMLATFADLYRQEVAAEEDVHRILPFFGTALGIVIGALAYAAGRLPKWTELATHRATAAFAVATLLLGLAIVEAGCVLVFLSRAIARRDYQRVGAEAELRGRLGTLQADYAARGMTGDPQDVQLVNDIRRVLLDSYTTITPLNRRLNQIRNRLRSRASSHLLRSLIWALAATTVIFVADKLSYLPKVNP